MSDNAVVSRPKRTGLAIALALVLVVPGMFLGGLAVLVYMFFTQLGMGDPGSSWIPFVDGVMKVVWVNVVPEAIRGFVAMAAALAITFLAFKEAEQSAVRYSVLTVYIVLAALLLLFNLFHVGFNGDTFGMIGLMAGFFAAALYSTD